MRASNWWIVLTTSCVLLVSDVWSKVCDSVECKKLASRMLVQMNHGDGPCENFYSYSCGELFKNPFLLEYDLEQDVLDRINSVLEKTNSSSRREFQQMKTFYDSCMYKNETEYMQEWVREVISVLNETGKFAANDHEDMNFTRLFLGLLKYDSPMALDITLDVDKTNRSRFILKIDVPVRASPFVLDDIALMKCQADSSGGGKATVDMPELYNNYTSCKDKYIKSSSSREVFEALEIMNTTEHFNISSQKALLIKFQVENFHTFNLQKMPRISEQKKTMSSREYKEITVRSLKRMYKGVEWDILLQELLHREIPEDTPVQLYSQSYFRELFKKITSKKKWDIYNSLLASLLHKLYTNFVIHKDISKQYCLRVTSAIMDDIVSAAYVSTFNESQLATISTGTQDVFQQIKHTLQHLLEGAEWLDPGSRSLLLSKLDSVHLAVGGAHSSFTNLSHLEHSMDEYPMDPKHYIKNSVRLLQRRRSLIYSVLDLQPEDPRSIWTHFLSPKSMSSVFDYSLNLVATPLALVANPFFSPSLPKYVVMARLGTELARQLAHHFDRVGLHYSNMGFSEEPIVEGKALEYYKGMEGCFDQQTTGPNTRRAQDGSPVNIELDGSLTDKSRLADDMSTMLVYSILQNSSFLEEPQLPFINMTNDKAFFILMAQNHCSKQSLLSSAVALHEEETFPPFLRVTNIASNSEAFRDTFECRPGSWLIPTLRCEIFPQLTINSQDFYLPPIGY